MRRTLIAGNWKMHGLTADLSWVEAFHRAANPNAPCDVLVCPPFTLLAAFAARCTDKAIEVGAQDCGPAVTGAYTGDVSAQMVADCGARYVITGHSERRAGHGETSEAVRTKADAALSAGLIPIICVGETLEDREAGRAEEVVSAQLRDSVPESVTGADVIVAYEPVWAIGTGRSASAEDAQSMHAHIRENWARGRAEALRILYGGSVKPDNSTEILAGADVDGALIGGASLDPECFASIVNSVR